MVEVLGVVFLGVAGLEAVVVEVVVLADVVVGLLVVEGLLVVVALVVIGGLLVVVDFVVVVDVVLRTTAGVGFIVLVVLVEMIVGGTVTVMLATSFCVCGGATELFEFAYSSVGVPLKEKE